VSLAIRLDHVGIVGHDLSVLATRFERLGFSLTPRAVTGDGRIQNRCVMLREGYLELMALAPGGTSATLSGFLAHHAGAHIIALSIEDLLTTQARLHRAGFACPAVEQSDRPIDAADSTGSRARFAHLPVPTQPEARINLIQHLTPELLWQPRFLAHANHAVALEDVTLRVAEPAQSAARFSRLAGCAVVPDPCGGYALPLSRGTIRLLPSDADMPPPAITALTLRTDDDAQAIRDVVTRAALPHHEEGSRLVIYPGQAGGVALRFT
jgi:Glyoxalase-like domain